MTVVVRDNVPPRAICIRGVAGGNSGAEASAPLDQGARAPPQTPRPWREVLQLVALSGGATQNNEETHTD